MQRHSPELDEGEWVTPEYRRMLETLGSHLQHFSDHFKSRPTPSSDPLFDLELANVEAVIDSSAPRLNEIQKGVKQLENGEWLRIDEVASEHLRYYKISKLC